LEWVVLSGLVAIIASASLMFGFERNQGGTIDDYGTAIWWAFATMTTVGYGDAYPITTEGRAVAIFLMIIGVSFFGWITANVAAFLVEFGGKTDRQVTLSDLMEKLESLGLITFPLGLDARRHD
jgi:voltage-gated potassium channel